MRKANGYGSVFKMKGNRRKPYAVVITKGFLLENGKAVQKRSYLGYYSSQAEAEIALANYNQNPYDTDVTFAQLYERWSKEKYEKISSGSKANFESAYKHFAPLYNKKFAGLKTSELEYTLLSCESVSQRIQMKTMLNQMYKYAMKYDIVQKNMAERFTVTRTETEIERKPFTDEEISALWKMDDDIAKVVLILIYTGMRVRELKSAEVDYSAWLLKGGLKTESGRDRIIPIREKIKPLFPISEAVTSLSTDAYYHRVQRFTNKMGHTTHDCRVTFSTRYKDKNPVIRKLIMGHAIEDITDRVYTKYTVEELREFIESVSF